MACFSGKAAIFVIVTASAPRKQYAGAAAAVRVSSPKGNASNDCAHCLHHALLGSLPAPAAYKIPWRTHSALRHGTGAFFAPSTAHVRSSFYFFVFVSPPCLFLSREHAHVWKHGEDKHIRAQAHIYLARAAASIQKLDGAAMIDDPETVRFCFMGARVASAAAAAPPRRSGERKQSAPRVKHACQL